MGTGGNMTNEFAFSKRGDELLRLSIEMENSNLKPGDMCIDPVWGLVQVPYDDLDLGDAR
jgi:hypothetical protein